MNEGSYASLGIGGNGRSKDSAIEIGRARIDCGLPKLNGRGDVEARSSLVEW